MRIQIILLFSFYLFANSNAQGLDRKQIISHTYIINIDSFRMIEANKITIPEKYNLIQIKRRNHIYRIEKKFYSELGKSKLKEDSVWYANFNLLTRQIIKYSYKGKEYYAIFYTKMDSNRLILNPVAYKKYLEEHFFIQNNVPFYVIYYDISENKITGARKDY